MEFEDEEQKESTKNIKFEKTEKEEDEEHMSNIKNILRRKDTLHLIGDSGAEGALRQVLRNMSNKKFELATIAPTGNICL